MTIMATQFVKKWWKTKFHVGGCSYKTMTVLGSNLSDGRRSDTEDLMKDDASSSYNNGAHINPCLASSSASENSHEIHHEFETHEVKFEDFECDVHVEESESGEERKEFSFTFYDLDGYGKITKDDVAGLVRSIYGAVNDSIKVPQGGKKTIKVRLTVTPEKSSSSCNNDEIEENININNNNLPPSKEMGNGYSGSFEGRRKVRNNVNVTIQENLHRERSSSMRMTTKEKEFKDRLCQPKFSSVRLPNGCKGCRNFTPEVFRDCSASPLRNRKKWREQRSCSLQRPELIDLVQFNMEKNNVSPCCRHEHTHHQQHSLISQQCPTATHNQHNQNQLSDPSCPMSLFRNENFWKQKLADLTQLQNNNNHNGCIINRHQNLKVHDCHNHKLSHHPHHHHHQCKKYGHHRSRSHDLSQQQNLLRQHLQTEQLVTQPPPIPSTPVTNNANQQCCNNNIVVNNIANQEEAECIELLQGCVLNGHHLSPRNKNTNVTNSASPHQLKHRNRSQEHARAMAQVISWLERENIGDGRISTPSKRKILNPNAESPPDVKKHEHHHVHEHIHHHYHHYAKETPIIV